MTPLEEHQTTKEAIRTRKEEKEALTQEDSRGKEEKEPRETQQEDHEPDKLGRLIEEWMGAEDEHWGKTTSPREDKKQQNAPHGTTETAEQAEPSAGGKRKMPNESLSPENLFVILRRNLSMAYCASGARFSFPPGRPGSSL